MSREHLMMQLKDFTRKAGCGAARIAKTVGNRSLDVADLALRNTYGRAWFELFDTGWRPSEYDEGQPKGWRDEGVNISYSLPFRIIPRYEGGDYDAKSQRQIRAEKVALNVPACKTHKVLRYWEPDFPQIIVHFQDPLPEYLGEEVLVLEPRGRARDFIEEGDKAEWRLWMPQSYVCIKEGGHEVRKSQAELTPVDVANMLSERISDASDGQILVYPSHLLSVISEMSGRRDSLRARWNLLEDHLTFQKLCLVEYPFHTAFLFYSMLESPTSSGEISSFITDMVRGNIHTYSGFVDRIRQIPNLRFNRGGAAITAVLFQGYQLGAAKDMEQKLQNVPPEFLISVPGIKFFIRSIEEYRDTLTPRIEEIVRATAQAQARALDYFKGVQDLHAEIWEDAYQALNTKKPELKLSIARKVSKEAAEIEKQIGGLIQGSSPFGFAESRRPKPGSRIIEGNYRDLEEEDDDLADSPRS